MSEKVRRFKNKTGFEDGTRWIEVKDGKSYFVDKRYKREDATIYSLRKCLQMVAQNDWIEF